MRPRTQPDLFGNEPPRHTFGDTVETHNGSGTIQGTSTSREGQHIYRVALDDGRTEYVKEEDLS